MSRGPDWNQTRALIAARLEPDERLAGMFTAITPYPESYSHGTIFIPELILLVRAAEHAVWRRSTQAASRSSQVPLAPRMIIAITDRRLVVWAADRRWRPRRLAGALSRDRIIGVTAKEGTSRVRTVVLELSAGETVTIRVDPEVAGVLPGMLVDASESAS